MKRLALVAALVLPLAGCTTIAQWTANTAQSLSSSTPTQVSTFATAVLAADGVTKAADIAVNTGTLDRPTLQQISQISDAVHDAFTHLKAANDAHESLNFAALNEALRQWNAYTTSKGITH